MGEKNKEALTNYLQCNEITEKIDINLIKQYLNLFYHKDQIYYSHSVSTLLTLSLFYKMK